MECSLGRRDEEEVGDGEEQEGEKATASVQHRSALPLLLVLSLPLSPLEVSLKNILTWGVLFDHTGRIQRRRRSRLLA